MIRHKVMAKLQGSYILKIDFCDPEYTVGCVISESMLLMVGRAIRYLSRTASIILQHLFQIIASAESFIEAIG